MIEIKFYMDNRGGIHMTLRGHAGTAPEGEDLVCAACTTLAYTAAQAVQDMNTLGKLMKPPKINIQRGRATIIATPQENAAAETLTVFRTVQCGARVLAHHYPKHVQLKTLCINNLESPTRRTGRIYSNEKL